MKIIKSNVNNCNSFNFQCGNIRVSLTHCPFLEYITNDKYKCPIEDKEINNINELQDWCPLEDYKEVDHKNPN